MTIGHFLYLIAIYIKKDQQSIQFLTIGHFYSYTIFSDCIAAFWTDIFLYFQHSKSCQNLQIHVLYIVSKLYPDVITLHVYHDTLTEFLYALQSCLLQVHLRVLIAFFPGCF